MLTKAGESLKRSWKPAEADLPETSALSLELQAHGALPSGVICYF
jgi:hypothetical protein